MIEKIKTFLGLSPYRIKNKNSLEALWYSPQEETLNLSEAKSRARDLIRNSAIISSIYKSIIDGVIGSGLKFKSDIDFKTIGFSGEVGEQVNSRIEKSFSIFGKKCGINDENFKTITELAFSSYLADGEFFFHFPVVRGELKVQIIESNEVEEIVYGKQGGSAHLSAHLSAYRIGGRKVEAYLKGKKVFHHYYRPYRPNQTRGLPPFISVLKLSDSLSEYIANEVEASRVTSMLNYVIKEEENYQGPALELGRLKIRTGQSIHLPKGVDLKTFSSQRPNSNFDKFVDFAINLIASNLLIPPDFVKRSFTRQSFLKNYSTRISKELADLAFANYRNHFIENFLSVCYEEIIDFLVLTGKLVLPRYQDFKYEYLRPKFVARSVKNINPQMETKAKVDALKHNLTTLKIELAKEGLDFEEVLKQRKIEKDLLKKYGLTEANNVGEQEEMELEDEEIDYEEQESEQDEAEGAEEDEREVKA